MANQFYTTKVNETLDKVKDAPVADQVANLSVILRNMAKALDETQDRLKVLENRADAEDQLAREQQERNNWGLGT